MITREEVTAMRVGVERGLQKTPGNQILIDLLRLIGEVEIFQDRHQFTVIVPANTFAAIKIQRCVKHDGGPLVCHCLLKEANDDLAAAHQISDSFFAALKPLHLDKIYVQDPGLHVTQLIDHITRLNRWVADLQSGLYVNCVYCGHQYGLGETTPVSMADALKAHVEQCREHPLSKLRENIWGIMRAIRESPRIDQETKRAIARQVDAALGTNQIKAESPDS